MRVLVACEYSGRVRDAFIARGHDAISCDLLLTERPGPHLQEDVRVVLQDSWDLVIAFPPCTDLAASNAHNLKIKEADGRMASASRFFLDCYHANAPRVAVENPVGVMSRLFRKPDQIIDPWMFGDPWKKKTCLWLRGLPKLEPTHKIDSYDQPVMPWHSGSGIYVGDGTRVFKGVGGARSAKLRAQTFEGVANAMAVAWGG